MIRAQDRARGFLVQKFFEEYQQLYQEEKDNCEYPNKFQKAQSRAKTRLVKNHPLDYLVLYEAAVASGCVRSAHAKVDND